MRVAGRGARMLIFTLRVLNDNLTSIGEFTFNILPKIVEEQNSIGLEAVFKLGHGCAVLSLLFECPILGRKI